MRRWKVNKVQTLRLYMNVEDNGTLYIRYPDDRVEFYLDGWRFSEFPFEEGNEPCLEYVGEL
jgi:hypothetical protein